LVADPKVHEFEAEGDPVAAGRCNLRRAEFDRRDNTLMLNKKLTAGL
jgi:hypothetical protein